ncbi:S-layer homology domain-containing protein [Paenibacillus yanchengensis]|uniref:S-layer homology domain-containing protein n=1 Tax=Paenibacillus yanchengensis TaxID=2035833 RepID=A0ABW4YH96_9BACL
MKQKNVKWLFISLAVLLMLPSSLAIAASTDLPTIDALNATGTTYYIDNTDGEDSNSGTTEDDAWQTLDKVNATTFLPGDQILFKAGETWSGQLYPKGSGAENKFITIGMYGTGDKPIIAGEGNVESTVYLYNQQYWEISHLEVTNLGSAPATSPRRGVHVSAEDYEKGSATNITNIKTLRGIYIHDLYVHSVNGQDEKDVNGSAGIQVSVKIAGRNTSGVPNPSNIHQRTTFDDVNISNNIIKDVSRSGIMTWNDWMNRELLGDDIGYGNSKFTPWTPLTNVIIRGNKLYNIGGDGIVPHMTDHALVEYNYLDGYNRTSKGYNVGMWTWAGDNTLYQFNEVTGGYSTRDGQPFDFDHGTQGIIYQYNYTYNNDGGTLLLCADGNGGGVRDNIFRYNISQNDKYQIFTICQGPNISNIHIYNNVFYVKENMNTNMLVGQGAGIDVALYNNVFINHGTGGYTVKPTWKYHNNAFYGNNVPNVDTFPDPFMITGDPKLIAPGLAQPILSTMDRIIPEQVDWSELDGYKLSANSPLINKGRFIGITHHPGVRDFFNLPIYNGMPDIGVHEFADKQYTPVTPFEPEIPKLKAKVINGDFENTTLHANAKPWVTQWNGRIEKTDEAYEGDYAGVVLAASTGGAIEQTIAAAPNTTYRLSAYTKISDSAQQVYFGVKGFEATPTTSTQVPVTSTSYEKVTIEFTTGENNSGFTMYFWQDTGPLLKAFIDNVSIEEVLADPPPQPVYPPYVPDVGQLLIKHEPATLIVGETEQLQIATLTNGKETDVTATAVYQSSDTSVASITATGEITAVSAGEVDILITFQQLSKTITIKVNNKQDSDGTDDPNKDSETEIVEETSPFTDTILHWAQKEITALSSQKWLQGYQDNTFKPDQSMTRAEWTALLIRALQLDQTKADDTSFQDVAKQHWAKQYIDIAVQLHIVNGKSVHVFAPEESITRQEAAIMIARALQLTSDNDSTILFSDVDDISAWALPAIQTLAEQDILHGYSDHTFKPLRAITRAEAAVLIHRLLEQL